MVSGEPPLRPGLSQHQAVCQRRLHACAAKPLPASPQQGRATRAPLDPYFPGALWGPPPPRPDPPTAPSSAPPCRRLLPLALPSDPRTLRVLVSTQRLSLGGHQSQPAALDSPCAQQPRVYFAPREARIHFQRAFLGASGQPLGRRLCLSRG